MEGALHDQLRKAEKRIAELAEALRPFADAFGNEECDLGFSVRDDSHACYHCEAMRLARKLLDD